MDIDELNRRAQTLEVFKVTRVGEYEMNRGYTIEYKFGSHKGSITEQDVCKAIEHMVRIAILSGD